jgi:ribonuclease PH
MRNDGRGHDGLRDIRITRGFISNPEGSVLFEMGSTKVICTAMVEEGVPNFLKDTGQGWVTAEYAMIPASTDTRTTRNRTSGRTFEIQRLIGRSLRVITDLRGFGERTIRIDCDVIQADGGTRTASITGSFIALFDAFRSLKDKGAIVQVPIKDMVAAISVGIVRSDIMLDLTYQEDSMADVDMNVVMTGGGLVVEIQGTAEEIPFSKDQMGQMIDLAERGIRELLAKQKEALGI